ncbi:RDD family protein [Sporosarcina thermotolerans]|uniref:RDD family protein n=1 Tax=Sporosarcina thermotolerans TaxID=633404 RepID=A0AAW9ABQ8_9BACL|nr:RDD family protein [Sporosarcina thermotolerans]MDW0118484.1 RDD family protein [Sporosarcina thermotolerans]WHT47741.1 RDD family protein [Sporosarcina thermotolerans]
MTDDVNQNQSMADVTGQSHLPQYEIIRTEQFRPKLAGFWTRFWAYVIDLMMVSAVSGILIKPIFRIFDIKISNPGFLLFSSYKVVIFVVFLTYFALMTKFFSQTIGKMIIGIKVVQKDGGELSWGTILFREVIGRFISKLLTIPYLLVIFMPKKEALHDLFADTYVIHEQSFEKEVVETKRLQKGEELQAGTIV